MTARDFQPTVSVKTSTSRLLYPSIIRRRFSSQNSSWVRRFFIDDLSITGFPPQSPVIGLGGFSPTTWSLETHQLPYGARMFSFVPRFSSSVQLIGWQVFYRVSIQDSPSNRRLHAQRSLRLGRKAIVILWSQDLPIT